MVSTRKYDKKKELDQFYTNPDIASLCIDRSINTFIQLGYCFDNLQFLEPSAGEGAFIQAVKKFGKSFAFDLDPKNKSIFKIDFLNDNISQKNINKKLLKLPSRKKLITIGNPPFGNRSKLAIRFINKAFEYSDTVAFIVPLMFQKYSAQSKIRTEAKLVFDTKIPSNSFLYEGKEYNVRCCWQIWTLRNSKLQNIRIKTSPITKHPDFEMWQYNNTPEAKKYFNKKKYNWNFAVPRQGYKNYSLKEKSPDNLSPSTQWIFFKAKSKKVLDLLYKIDFQKLSYKNTTVPGFGKADVIQEFNQMFSNYEKVI
ncbi:MAG: hypothetical protein LBT99_03545 [Bifidobacteriaceae bacterium]|jgi:predicted RNA methylase|nr:hypothetical protein [Bifidobacteriaceae bacterium]